MTYTLEKNVRYLCTSLNVKYPLTPNRQTTSSIDFSPMPKYDLPYLKYCIWCSSLLTSSVLWWVTLISIRKSKTLCDKVPLFFIVFEFSRYVKREVVTAARLFNRCELRGKSYVWKWCWSSAFIERTPLYAYVVIRPTQGYIFIST